MTEVEAVTLDAAADVLDAHPLFATLGAGMANRLRGFAAMLRHQPTHTRGHGEQLDR